jgi:restriction system protein
VVLANDVRAMLGVITGDPNTSKGIVTTTSDFAPKIKDDPILKPYFPHRLELVNGKELIDRLSRLA